MTNKPIKIIQQSICSILQKGRAQLETFSWKATALILTLCAPVFSFALDPTKDILVGAQGDITANFGPGSTFAFIVYAVELFSCAIAAGTTKKYWLFAGAILVPAITAIIWSVIAPAA